MAPQTPRKALEQLPWGKSAFIQSLGAFWELGTVLGDSLCTAQGTLSLSLLGTTCASLKWGAKSETANKAIAVQSGGEAALGEGVGVRGLYKGRTLTHQGWRLAC